MEQLGLNGDRQNMDLDRPLLINSIPYANQDEQFFFGEEEELGQGGGEGEDGEGMVGKWGQKRPRVDACRRVPSKRLTGGKEDLDKHRPTSPPRRGQTR